MPILPAPSAVHQPADRPTIAAVALAQLQGGTTLYDRESPEAIEAYQAGYAAAYYNIPPVSIPADLHDDLVDFFLDGMEAGIEATNADRQAAFDQELAEAADHDAIYGDWELMSTVD